MSDGYRIISTYSSGIMLNWNDMRTKFGYNLLYAIGLRRADSKLEKNYESGRK
jgi:hypothetical protein